MLNKITIINNTLRNDMVLILVTMTTIDTPNTDKPEEPRAKHLRSSPMSLDEDYINAYLQHPEKGQTAAIRQAGYTGNHPSQRAHKLHKRLSGEIEKALNIKMAESTALGHGIICDIAINAESEATRLSAAKMLLDYGGKKPTDKLAFQSESREPEDIDAEITAIHRRIWIAKGENPDSFDESAIALALSG
jgi:hypothetical protein